MGPYCNAHIKGGRKGMGPNWRPVLLGDRVHHSPSLLVSSTLWSTRRSRILLGPIKRILSCTCLDSRELEQQEPMIQADEGSSMVLATTWELTERKGHELGTTLSRARKGNPGALLQTPVGKAREIFEVLPDEPNSIPPCGLLLPSLI